MIDTYRLQRLRLRRADLGSFSHRTGAAAAAGHNTRGAAEFGYLLPEVFAGLRRGVQPDQRPGAINTTGVHPEGGGLRLPR